MMDVSYPHEVLPKNMLRHLTFVALPIGKVKVLSLYNSDR